jgi:hypothetical protein
LKTCGEVMEILEAFGLKGTLRGAAELAGCDHKTVAHWVRARDAAGGGLPVATRPRPQVNAFAEKVEEWVQRSRGKIRADVCHQRLVAMGYVGSERTTRRAVAEAKRRWRAEHGRRTRPWVVEPGLWMQWDYGDGARRRWALDGVVLRQPPTASSCPTAPTPPGTGSKQAMMALDERCGRSVARRPMH